MSDSARCFSAHHGEVVAGGHKVEPGFSPGRGFVAVCAEDTDCQAMTVGGVPDVPAVLSDRLTDPPTRRVAEIQREVVGADVEAEQSGNCSDLR